VEEKWRNFEQNFENSEQNSAKPIAKEVTDIAEASKNPRNTLTWTIDARNEIHSRSNPIKRPNNGEFQAIFSTLTCQQSHK